MQYQAVTIYQLMDKVTLLNILKELIVIYKSVRQHVAKIIIMCKITVKFVQQAVKVIILNKMINKNNVPHNVQQYLLVNYASKVRVLDYHKSKTTNNINILKVKNVKINVITIQKVRHQQHVPHQMKYVQYNKLIQLLIITEYVLKTVNKNLVNIFHIM